MTEATLKVPQTHLYRNLIDESLFDRLSRRVAKDKAISITEAEAIVDAALGFIKLCADFPNVGFSPSEKVDIGWHTFILYTMEYAAFCDEIAGRFIHHIPTDSAETENEGFDTVAFMSERGIVFNRHLWAQPAADCCEGVPLCMPEPGPEQPPLCVRG